MIILDFEFWILNWECYDTGEKEGERIRAEGPSEIGFAFHGVNIGLRAWGIEQRVKREGQKLRREF